VNNIDRRAQEIKAKNCCNPANPPSVSGICRGPFLKNQMNEVSTISMPNRLDRDLFSKIKRYRIFPYDALI
jgi:hypothetical protein